jgi:membrane-associated phospholipid phosphatase
MRFRGSYTAVVCAILCVLAIAFADRPIVLALDPGYRQSAAWVVVDEIFHAIEPLFVLGAIGGAWLMFTERGRRTAAPWADDLRACMLIGVVALVAAAVLKVVFGRSGPDFNFVRDGIYEFRWFTGEWTPYHGAFPSGTAAVASAMTAALWMRRSPFRFAGVALAVVLSIGVVVQQYHWLSDAIAGAAVGVLTAGTVFRLAPPGLAWRATESYTPL